MKIGSFEFNVRELAGSMGDFGTLFPLAISDITICSLDPAGLLLIIGLVNIITGLVYRLPMPVEPMKIITIVAIAEHWTPSMVYTAGFAQVPLTVTNATIATAALIKTYWLEKSVREKQLAWNQGIMNLILPFLGGMPTCHSAGGLAGQYNFGARTGGTNIIEGIIEISLGIFFSASIAGLFIMFPKTIIGAMMFLAGIELTKFARTFVPAGR